ncbi:uncharacterized protein LOC128177346 isoform X1 [Crassostrea angulata]|uniref:uncharacterized protein LOC128177346 isoform X1 n=1 Tax=Magallana angulata TaxID=2784310 RepID=UPI0022B087DD|nr:uncharacterized protein LOC128177346 isoform X1 [Crassostrea angulata]
MFVKRQLYRLGSYECQRTILIFGVICLQYTWALSIQRSLNKDHLKKEQMQQIEDIFPALIENEEEWGPFEMGKGQGVGFGHTPISLDVEETGLDRKLLGLPGWEYLTVGMVVVVAAVIGGSVAIVCKKCGGLFGRRSEKGSAVNLDEV